MEFKKINEFRNNWVLLNAPWIYLGFVLDLSDIDLLDIDLLDAG